jgi:hypothetical protein
MHHMQRASATAESRARQRGVVKGHSSLQRKRRPPIVSKTTSVGFIPFSPRERTTPGRIEHIAMTHLNEHARACAAEQPKPLRGERGERRPAEELVERHG